MINNEWEKINVLRGLEYKILYIILNKIKILLSYYFIVSIFKKF